jgi:hypothetical protein
MNGISDIRMRVFGYKPTTPPKHTAVRYLALAQLWFLVLILVCFALQPQALTANDGLSYFGVHWQTIIPFGLACTLAGFFTLRAADTLPPARWPLGLVAQVLRVSGLLLAGILFTPYSIGPIFDSIHRLFGTVLFLSQLGLAGWLSLRGRLSVFNALLLLLQFTGGVLAYLSLNDWLPFEVLGQLLFQAAFGLLIIRLVSAELDTPAPQMPAPPSNQS